MNSSTLILLGVMFATRNIDWEVDNRLLMLRMAWGMVHVIAGVVIFLLYQRISASKGTPEANKTISVKVASSMSNPNPEGEEKMFVSEYDERQLRELVTGVALPAALILFFHIYMGAIVPLISTTLLTLTRLYENKLVKIYLLKQNTADLQRPFPVPENPLQKLMESFTGGGANANAAAPASAAAAPATDTPKSVKSKKTD